MMVGAPELFAFRRRTTNTATTKGDMSELAERVITISRRLHDDLGTALSLVSIAQEFRHYDGAPFDSGAEGVEEENRAARSRRSAIRFMGIGATLAWEQILGQPPDADVFLGLSRKDQSVMAHKVFHAFNIELRRKLLTILGASREWSIPCRSISHFLLRQIPNDDRYVCDESLAELATEVLGGTDTGRYAVTGGVYDPPDRRVRHNCRIGIRLLVDDAHAAALGAELRIHSPSPAVISDGATPPPATEAIHRVKLLEPDRLILLAALELGAIREDCRANADKIVARAFGKQANPPSYGVYLSGLTRNMLLQVKKGTGGGYWLTPAGVREAADLMDD